MKTKAANISANKKGRSREGAWIENAKKQAALQRQNVAPARERGLKKRWYERAARGGTRSLPRGSVD